MNSDAESNNVLVADPSPGPRFSKKVVAAVLAGAAVLFAPVAIHLAQPALVQQGDVESVQVDAEVFGSKLDECADTTKNCFDNKCCKTTGFSCFQTGPKTAKCAAACPPGSSCTALVPFYKSKPAWTCRMAQVPCKKILAGKLQRTLPFWALSGSKKSQWS